MANSVEIKFLFANYEGVSVVIQSNTKEKVAEVKQKLIAEWPEGKRLHLNLIN
jgi:hypothetical protein